IEKQRDIRDDPEDLVIKNHHDCDQDKADDERTGALLDILFTQARADGTLLDDVHGRGQSTGTQQQRQIARFVGTVESGDLETFADAIANRRDVNVLLDFLLGVHFSTVDFLGFRLGFTVHDRHRLADTLSRDIAHFTSAYAVQRHEYGRRT